MKILFCNKYNYTFSGTEAYLFELMELLSAQGHATALFSMADPRGRSTPYDRFLVPPVNFKDESNGLVARLHLAARAVYSWEVRARLRRMIADFRPDVAHVRNIYHHLTPSILWELKKQGVPVLYHLNDFKLLCPNYNLLSHGQACERCCGGKFWHVVTEGCSQGPRGASMALAAEAYFHKWLGTYQRCVDVFLAPSQFVRSKLIEYGWLAERIEVLPHFQRVSPAALPAPGEKAPVLYFGRLSAEKGVHDLLHAMQRLPNLHLNIAGEGPQQPELESLASKLHLRNVTFLGHQNAAALRSLIAESRFTIFPSRAYETMGKSILESYAEGRAVVASDLGSRRELVHEAKTGTLFPPGNIERMIAAIAHLAENPARARGMGLAGRALVERDHTPQSHVASLLELYARMHKPAALRISAPARPKPRVAFIGGRGVVSQYSGIEAYYEEAGKRLAAAGYRVTVYCRSYFTPKVKEHEGMRVVRLPTIRSKHLDTFIHTLLSTIHAIVKDYDIVHYHTLGPALFSFLPRIFGKKTVVTVQGLDWQRKKWGRFAARILRRGETASAHFPNATIVVSQTLRNHYQVCHGKETFCIPNGGKLLQERAGSCLARLDLTPDSYVLFVGRLSPEKNCHLLIEAFERLNTTVKLVLAGGSAQPDGYTAALLQRQTDRILMPGWVSGVELEELITNALLFALPSDLEGLSLALLDAMGAGVCVLTSDIPENREVVEGAGFTFRPGDVDDLTRMLHLIISRRELRETAARRGQQRIRERYLWRNVVDQLDQFYCSLVGSNSPIDMADSSRKLPALKRAA